MINADVLQQARDVIQSYERQEPYVNGRFATTTEIILARELLRLAASLPQKDEA